jgi:hypothetical protein
MLRASGDSVRGIAAKLSEMTGERIAPSSVHQYLKGTGNGTNSDGAADDPALAMGGADRPEIGAGQAPEVSEVALHWMGGAVTFGAGLWIGSINIGYALPLIFGFVTGAGVAWLVVKNWRRI